MSHYYIPIGDLVVELDAVEHGLELPTPVGGGVISPKEALELIRSLVPSVGRWACLPSGSPGK